MFESRQRRSSIPELHMERLLDALLRALSSWMWATRGWYWQVDNYSRRRAVASLAVTVTERMAKVMVAREVTYIKLTFPSADFLWSPEIISRPP